MRRRSNALAFVAVEAMHDRGEGSETRRARTPLRLAASSPRTDQAIVVESPRPLEAINGRPLAVEWDAFGRVAVQSGPSRLPRIALLRVRASPPSWSLSALVCSSTRSQCSCFKSPPDRRLCRLAGARRPLRASQWASRSSTSVGMRFGCRLSCTLALVSLEFAEKPADPAKRPMARCAIHP